MRKLSGIPGLACLDGCLKILLENKVCYEMALLTK